MRYAALLENLTEEDGNRVFASLKPSREESRALGRFLKHRGWADFDELSIIRLMGKTTDSFPSLLGRYEHVTGRITEDASAEISRISERIISENKPRRVSDLKINGTDLMSLGLTGRAIGQTLDKLLDAVIMGDVENEREALKEKVISYGL